MTNNLGLTAVTDTQTQKEVTINDDFGLVDSRLTEGVTLTMAGAETTAQPSTSQWTEHTFFLVTGTTSDPSPSFKIQDTPNGLFVVQNDIGQDLLIDTDAGMGSPLTLPDGDTRAYIYVGGADIIELQAEPGSSASVENSFTINKASSGDDAALIFTTAATPVASIGTLGTDNIHVDIGGSDVAIFDAGGLSISTTVQTTAGVIPLAVVTPSAQAGIFSWGDTGAFFSARRSQSVVSGATLQIQKTRGSIASPSGVITNDQAGQVQWTMSYNGTNYVQVATLLAQITEGTPGSGAMGSRVISQICPTGSVTLTEFWRQEHATGLSMFGANVVIDADRNFRLRNYTVSTTPAHVEGKRIYLSDIDRGATSDGTNWVYDSGATAPVTTSSATKNTALTDFDDLIIGTNAAGLNVTVLANASVAFPIGTVLTGYATLGTFTWTADSGVTINPPPGFTLVTAGAYAMTSVVKVGTNEWTATGQMAP